MQFSVAYASHVESCVSKSPCHFHMQFAYLCMFLLGCGVLQSCNLIICMYSNILASATVLVISLTLGVLLQFLWEVDNMTTQLLFFFGLYSFYSVKLKISYKSLTLFGCFIKYMFGSCEFHTTFRLRFGSMFHQTILSSLRRLDKHMGANLVCRFFFGGGLHSSYISFLQKYFKFLRPQ